MKNGSAYVARKPVSEIGFREKYALYENEFPSELFNVEWM